MLRTKITDFFDHKFNLKWLIVITSISVSWVNFNHERWLSFDIMSHDKAHYYSYLPALFYENDLKLSFLNDTVNQKLHNKYYAPNHTPEGKAVIKMSMGMAFSYLPFF